MPVRPSAGWVSVTFMHCIKTSKHIKLFSSSDSHTIPVLLYQTLWQYSVGDPHNRGVERRWAIKNRDFRPVYRFILEMTQNRAIVSIERQYDLVCNLLNGAISNGLE